MKTKRYILFDWNKQEGLLTLEKGKQEGEGGK
jgi:hypothetical protein